MKKTVLTIISAVILVLTISLAVIPAFATNEAPVDAVAPVAAATADGLSEEGQVEEFKAEDGLKSTKAIAAAIIIAVVATAGAIGMAIAIVKSVGGIARQPEASGNIRTTLMLGLVFIETCIIYALIVAILVIFVL